MNQRRKTIGKLDILQFLIMAALLVFMILMLTAGNSKVVPMSTIEAGMEEIPSVKELTKKDMNDVAKTFSVDTSLIDEGIYYRVDDIMNVNELLILRIDDDDNRQKVIEAVNKYLKEKTDSFNGYGTNQYGLLSSAVTTERGTYFFYGVSEDVLEWETAFLKLIR